MAPGISKGQVSQVVSIAKQLQNMQDIRGLESVVSQYLPAEMPKETEISDEVMYELGETLRIDSKYMEQALRLYSDSPEDLFQALDEMGVAPSTDLIREWLKKLRDKHQQLTLSFLNEITNPKYPFIDVGKENWDVTYTLGHAEDRRTRIFNAHFSLYYSSGKICFSHNCNGKGQVTAAVFLEAFTKNILTLFAGPVRDLTLQIPKISSCIVGYNPRNKNFIPKQSYSADVKDPY